MNRLNYGFIAEEIDDIDVDETHSVVGRKTIEGESVPDFVRMDNLIPFMVAEMKKMKVRIDELESEVEELKNS